MISLKKQSKVYVENEDGTCSTVTEEQWELYIAMRAAVGDELADKLFPHAAARWRQSVKNLKRPPSAGTMTA